MKSGSATARALPMMALITRLDRPYIRDGKKLREASWEEAFAFTAKTLKKLKGNEIAALAGDLVDVNPWWR